MNDDYYLWDNWYNYQVARGTKEEMTARRREKNRNSQSGRYSVVHAK